MTKFRSFFEEALRLPYKSNSQDNPLHELQVQALLIKYGFEYEYQPNGLQQSPDFRVTLELTDCHTQIYSVVVCAFIICSK